jgi:hypothetical protein
LVEQEHHPASGEHAASPNPAAARRSFWHRAVVRPAKALALLLYALAYMCALAVFAAFVVFASAGGLASPDVKIDPCKHLRAWWDRFGPYSITLD